MAAKAPGQRLTTKKAKQTDAEQVAQYMLALVHPLKSEIEALRKVILDTDSRLQERIKWAAPSYYCGVDLLTFNHRMQDKVHLIFHHEAIVQIASTMLEGNYKDRRMMYFPDMAAVVAGTPEIQRIITEYLALIIPASPANEDKQ